MALEAECKYLDVDLTSLRVRLKEIGGEHLAGPYFEMNVVLDDERRSLREKGVLLRVRCTPDKTVLTIKEPVRKRKGLKICEEHETSVGSVDDTLAGLKALGYNPAFRYEKVREKWRFGSVLICMDQLPFGDFVELEGSADDIPEVAKALQISEQETSAETYYALNRHWRQAEGLSQDESFIFSESARAIMSPVFFKPRHSTSR